MNLRKAVWAVALFATVAITTGACREGGASLSVPPGSVSGAPAAGGAAASATTSMPAVDPAARPMAMTAAAAPPAPPPGLPVAPPKGPDPTAGKFTLDDATKGLGGKPGGKITAAIETTMGTFHCDLWDKLAPNTVASFVGLARGVRPFADPATGEWVKRPFFDGLAFHRVIPNFMIQGGDPNTAGWLEGKPGYGMAGTGNPGFKFDDEIHAENHFVGGGFLAMANAGVRDGKGTNGSQFFVTINPDLKRLDAKHTIFGKCAELDLAVSIAGVPRHMAGMTRDRPITPVGIKKLTIARE